MHSLEVMRKTCREALDNEGDGAGEDLFRGVVDPQAVLKLATITGRNNELNPLLKCLNYCVWLRSNLVLNASKEFIRSVRVTFS
jgi:hypothetical protein